MYSVTLLYCHLVTKKHINKIRVCDKCLMCSCGKRGKTCFMTSFCPALNNLKIFICRLYVNWKNEVKKYNNNWHMYMVLYFFSHGRWKARCPDRRWVTNLKKLRLVFFIFDQLNKKFLLNSTIFNKTNIYICINN